MNYRLVPPVLRYGVNLANAIYFPFPMDNVFSGSEPRADSEQLQYPSGVEDAWRIGTDYVLAGTHRWLAQSDTLYYPRCTGWDGTLGIRAALEYLQDKNSFSWHPDGRNIVRLPKLNGAGAVSLGGFGGWGQQTDAGLTSPLNQFDGVETAWKLSATNGTGITKFVGIWQLVPAIAGESMTISADYKVSGLSGGATGFIQIDNFDSTPTFLSTVASATGLTSTGYVRATGGPSTLPASTAYARISLFLSLPAGAAGTIWFKNAMMRRDSTDSTFIDNPSIDGCYLVQPIEFTPANETDGSRQLVAKIRSPNAPFDGY